MFNDKSRPITEQILEEMKNAGFDNDVIEYAKKEMLEKKNIDFAIGLAKHLALLKIGNSILKGIDEGKIKLDDLDEN